MIDIDRSNIKHEIYVVSCLCAMLMLSGIIFWPALNGTFMLDDLVHLPKMSLYGSVDSKFKLFQYIFTFGGLGRPISFLSFLLNDNSWPTSPWSFKYTNLCIHLLNSILIFKFIKILLNSFNSSSKSNYNYVNYVALLTCSIWLISPIHLSTMMMVVQRMTLLSGTFTLFGLIFYLKSRVLINTDPRLAFCMMSVSVVLFCTLSVLSKENGIILLFYIPVIEYFLLCKNKKIESNLIKYWLVLFSFFPFLVLSIYFLSNISDYQVTFNYMRKFSMVERLLTESRILMDYVRIIIFPDISRTGPYHDDYVISKSILDPLSTGLSIFVIGLVIFLSFRFKDSFPIFSYGVIWFFTGHMIESTFLPLELYFEHRNYLPMIGIMLPISFYLINYNGKIKSLLSIVVVIYLIMESFITYSVATVWGDKSLYSIIWAEENPGSVRAQLDALKYSTEIHNQGMMNNYISNIVDNNPYDSTAVLLPFLLNKCSSDVYGYPGDFNSFLNKLKKADFSYGIIESIGYMQKAHKSKECEISSDDIVKVIQAALDNKSFSKIKKVNAILHTELAALYVRIGDLDHAIKSMDKAYDSLPKYEYCLSQAEWLYSAGLYSDSKKYILKAKESPSVLMYEFLWKKEHINDVENILFNGKIKQS